MDIRGRRARVRPKDAGHAYELDNEGMGKQVLQFVKKVRSKVRPAELVTTVDGTTNEAVLEALIDRMGRLQQSAPCSENLDCMYHLQMALHALALRTTRRKALGIENTPHETKMLNDPDLVMETKAGEDAGPQGGTEGEATQPPSGPVPDAPPAGTPGSGTPIPGGPPTAPGEASAPPEQEKKPETDAPW